MEPLSLSPEGRFPPLLKRCRTVVLIDSFVEALRKAFGKVANGKRVVDVEVSVVNEFFKLCNVTVRVLRIHLESLHDERPGFLFL